VKSNLIIGAIGLTLGLSLASRLSAKSDATLDETLKWIERHRADFQAEWHTADGPTRWQPEDFKNFTDSRNLFWQRTIKWTGRSESPHFSKGLETDGESYSITSAISFLGNVTDKGEQAATRDKSFTRQVSATYTWRLKISQISPDSVVMDYRDYLKLTNQTDNPSVDLGTYYYVCILPKPDAEKDAIVEITNDQRTDDGQGIVSIVKGHTEAAPIAGIAAVQDRKMAERLANAVGHLVGLLQAQILKQPKEAF